MVKIINKNLSKEIENGSYFKESFNWYCEKYLLPITERNYLILLAICSIFFCVTTGININALLTEGKKTPIIIKREGDAKTFPVITSISKIYKKTQDSVARYLLIDYVMTREEYFFKNNDTKKRIKKLKRTSSKSVLREYQNFTSKFNPNSLLNKYRDHTNRLIEVRLVKFIDSTGSFRQAKVNFRSVEQSFGKKSVVKDWEATINYRLTNVDYIANNNAPLRFVINYYKVKPLKK